jgi:outer membrane receptor protein involved in Fe transport
LVVLPVLFCSTAALAQEKPKTDKNGDDQLQEVVVTGSHIARPELDTLEPTTVVDSKTFDRRGYTDVGQALSEVPGFAIQPTSAAQTQNSTGIAQSFVDLYGLGSQRTLVLVNGRRFVSSNTASLNGVANDNNGPGSQVDLNTIPTKLIDHVDVVSVGGAPIYGTDAIAGTVNIILKKDFQGVDVDGQVGVSNAKDAWNERFRGLFGHNFADGRGNITAVFELSKADGLVGTARSVYAQDLGFFAPNGTSPYKTVLTPANSVASVNYSGIPLVDDAFFAPAFGLNPSTYGVTNGAGQVLAWQPGSSALQPYNLGTPTGNPIFWSGGDGLRLSQVSNLLSPTEKINADFLGNFEIAEHISAFGEGWFSETHAANLRAQPAYNSNLFGAGGTVNGNFVVNLNNPFLSAADRTLIGNALANYLAAVGPTGTIFQGATNPSGVNYPAWNLNQFYVARANVDLQGGEATGNQVLGRGVAGLKGDFDIGARQFNWEVAANYGYSRNIGVQPAYVFQNVQNALNATTNAAGQIVCAGTPVNSPVPTQSSTCAPLNIFGLGSPSAAAVAYVTHLASATSYDTQRDVTANLSGDVYKLPAGDIKFAAGFENRRDSQNFSPDSYYLDSAGTITATGVEGSFINNEFYGELLVPIISGFQDIPVVHELQLEGAARRVDNSIVGSSTTWTEGMRWAPIEDVMFRANRTKSIRAPSVTELFLPSATSFQFANDPCDKNFVNQGNSPATRKANCTAAGIDTSTFVSNVVNATAIGTTSGNSSLTAEVADSRTIGVVLRPRWVQHLSLNVDYIDIKLQGAISSLTLQQLLDACYDSTGYPNTASCKSFTRNAAGQITGFHAGYTNAGQLEYSGWNGTLAWMLDLPSALGNLNFSLNYSDTGKLVSKIGSASPNTISGQVGTPKTRGSLDVIYEKGPFSWDWQGQFYGAANFNNLDPANQKDFPRVAAWWVINSTVAYDVSKNITVRLIVDNVFNKEPPFPALAGVQGNFTDATTEYFSGIIGRTYLLSGNVHF